MLAWYFSTSERKLRYDDGRRIVVGKSHSVKDIPKLCSKGLHASIRLIDALKYAPGNILYLVDVSRKLAIGEDKICGQRRKYLVELDTEDVLREFARKQALINISKIEPYTDKYKLIVTYLKTGDPSLRSAAESAARSAARSAAWSAAESAARSAAWSAARSAARSAAWSAAWSAAESAANVMLTKMVKEKIRCSPKKKE